MPAGQGLRKAAMAPGRDEIRIPLAPMLWHNLVSIFRKKVSTNIEINCSI